jgi:spore maturation protein CgeB
VAPPLSARPSREQRDASDSPRICLPTARRFSRKAFQCAHLEAQDVLAQIDDVDMICLEAEPGFPRKQQWIRRLMYRDVSRRLAFWNPGLKRVRLTRDYDLLVVMCQTYWDFLNVNAIDGWKDRVKTSVCWIDELWAASLPLYKYWLPSLKRFDHVVVGMHGTVAPLSDAIGRRCHYVPGGVDAIRFSPYPDAPDRVVDVYSVGRKWDGPHRALLKQSAANEIFYIHDTLQTGESEAADHRQHRDLYANTAKRSRFFMVAPGKTDVLAETQGQVEVGFRYYEGAAAGTVMIGRAPDCQPFREMFNWPDVVVEIDPNGSDVADVLSRLRAEPERLRDISRRNAQHALRRHDWSYRWKRILEIAGLQPAAGMHTREKTLNELAEHGNPA